jgi:hypothetical protein
MLLQCWIVFILLLGRRGDAFHAHSATHAPTKTTGSRLHATTGPKASGRRSSTRGGGSRSTASSERLARRKREQVKKQDAPKDVPFDGKMLTSKQSPNLDAPSFDLEADLASSSRSLRCMTPNLQHGKSLKSGVFVYMSLDDLLEPHHSVKLSQTFNADAEFRNNLRAAIRRDIFDTTPFYANLSEKAASILLLPESSLEGSWRISGDGLRMKHTTTVLREAFFETANGGDEAKIPSGDDLFRAIGKLCGERASTHFIDIFGVQDRSINHSWHLDAGCSPGSCRTVLWGFPPEDSYSGCGVFSHVVPLTKECLAPPDHNRMEPVLFEGKIPEEFIVRPLYEEGKELLLYRDIDVLHSAPDVAYRTSIMRFM